MPEPTPIEDDYPAPGDRDLRGRVWWGHGDTSDPYTGEHYDPCWTLAEEPWDGATHWLPAADLPLANAVFRDEPEDFRDPDEDFRAALTAAERNPSMCRTRYA